MALISLLGTLATALAAYALWKLISIFMSCSQKSLRGLPGPPRSSWFFGNSLDIRHAGNAVLQEAWIEKYGKTLTYKGLLNGDKLYTVDTRALNHILTHMDVYVKTEFAHFLLGGVLGEGVLLAEGARHRNQRKIMNPAFGPAQIRELTDIFVEKATELRDVWSNAFSRDEEFARIDVLEGLTKMTLDVIGLAGFNHRFDSLNAAKDNDELREAMSIMFDTTQAERSNMPILKFIFPLLRLIPDPNSKQDIAAKDVMTRIGMRLIQEKKAEILKATQADAKTDDTSETLQSRDLLTLLIKANMATDIADDRRLSDDDVLAQVPTFLVAGHETTSVSTTWCLFALSRAPEVQQKLREELMTVSTDNPSMDDLQALPYLDAVVRETLRVHAPVPSTTRSVAKDDVIPLNTPYIDIHGQAHDSVNVSKGTTIDIPILALNRSKELWGEDAFDFKPERWEEIPSSVHAIPGVWGNMMTFLGGPRACIGYRFSLVEMKALIFILVRAFEFELAVTAEEIIASSGTVVQRPLVRGETDRGAQMPLLIRPCKGL